MITDPEDIKFHIAGHITRGGADPISVVYNSNESYLTSLGLIDYDYHAADDVRMSVIIKDENGLESSFTIDDLIVATSEWITDF